LGLIRNIFNFIKDAKRKNPKQIVCPRCGSIKIKPYTSLSSWLTPEEYLCEECGYKGSIILEVEKEKTLKPLY
jgi:predicted RNA-binding Zn-ribbon protein involved in translation (DUF1610 family)